MNWGSAAEFFAMGGRGLYVWGSYLMFAVCLAIEVYALRSRRKRLMVELRDGASESRAP